MKTNLKRSRTTIDKDEKREPIQCQVDLNGWNPSPPVVPKRGRGRPKVVKSLEFEVSRPSSSKVNTIKNHLQNLPPVAPNPGVSKSSDWPAGLDLLDETNKGEDPLYTEPTAGQSKDKLNKTPNDLLKEWLDAHANDYLGTWYEHDAPPLMDQCQLCSELTHVLYRCGSCIGAGYFCADCARTIHRFTPTHRLKYWDGLSWINAALVDLDYVLCLGPHNGKPCDSSKEPSNLLIGNIDGFTQTRVHYCYCSEASTRPLQLLSIGLFPCSHQYPELALTLQLLDMYNLLTTVGRTSAHKYYTVLERYTKPGFQMEVDDRYRELMWTHRRHLELLNRRRTGHSFPTHPDIDTHSGDQAFDCVACPRPGFNFEWCEVEEDEIAWFRAWFSYDGNFRMVRKCKKVAEGDICLSDGKGYIPVEELL